MVGAYFSVILFLMQLPVSTQQLYKRVDRVNDDSIYVAVQNATGGLLTNAAFQKKVTIKGTTCSTASTSFLVNAVGAYQPGRAITPTTPSSSAMYIRCNVDCVIPAPTRSPAITPSNSLTDLIAGQNVVMTGLNTSTYILQISTSQLALAANTRITLNLREGVLQSDLVIEVQPLGNSLLLSYDPNIFRQIDINEPIGISQITIMTDKNRSTGGVIVLFNGVEFHSVPQGQLEGFTLSLPSDIVLSDGNIIGEWTIFDRLVSTQELHQMRTGVPPSVYPAAECPCPDDYPIFERWNNHGSDEWRGMMCKFIDNLSNVKRLDANSHQAQLITDGVIGGNDFWVSENDAVNKLTIDLGTTYQVFYAEVTLLTLPRYLVVTKKTEGRDIENVLLVVTRNCSNPLPSDLPQARPLKCIDSTAGLIKIFKTSTSDRNAGVLRLDWVTEILNQGEFSSALANGTFEAESISFYMSGLEGIVGPDRYIIVNEIEIYGSCGCAENRQCSLATSLVNRRKRAAVIQTPANFRQISLSPTFENTFGFSCNCSSTNREELCRACAYQHYMARDGCQPCSCSVGSVNGTCDRDGQCLCNTTGAGDQPNRADDKCHPFVSSITPKFGPIAGGTQLRLRGGWLDRVTYVNIGYQRCNISSSRNSTNFHCTTAPAGEGVVGVYTDNTEPLVNFTFRPNPNITAIARADVFLSGGLDIPVSGTSLDSIAEPKIVVSVTCITTGEVVAELKEDCLVLNATQMSCKSPDLKSTFNNLSESACPGPTAKRKRRATNDINSKYTFDIGFELDGVEEFKDLSKVAALKDSSSLYVRQNPTIFEFTEENRIKKLPIGSKTLDISGLYLTSGTSVRDFIIKIGDGKCKPTLLYHNLLKCELPEVFPEAGLDSVIHPDGLDENIPAVIVEVGNIKSQIGYVYIEKIIATTTATTTTTTNWGLVIGLPVTAILIAVVVIVLALLLYRKKNRKETTANTKSFYTVSGSRYVSEPGSGVVILGDNELDSDHMDTLKYRLIPLEHLKIGEKLGQGQFGKVYLGELQMKSGPPKKVAVKTIKAELHRTDPQAVTNFLQEAILMKDFDHTNVLSLIGVVLNEQQMPMVILPFMAKGDLKHVLRDEDEDFSIGDLIHFGLQVANGMNYLAKKKFIHRDLAARNCMVNEQYLVKIADFGLSHDIYAEDYYRAQDRTKPLPVKWMAIESLTSGKYTVESDVWSYGILVWEIMTRGCAPYPGVNNYEIRDYLKVGRRLTQPDLCPDEIYIVMCSCWDLIPQNRPKFAEIWDRLTTFLDENNAHRRRQTMEIEDDYYTQRATSEYSPQYVIGETPIDYEIPEPANIAPSPLTKRASGLQYSNINQMEHYAAQNLPVHSSNSMLTKDRKTSAGSQNSKSSKNRADSKNSNGLPKSSTDIPVGDYLKPSKSQTRKPVPASRLFKQNHQGTTPQTCSQYVNVV